jgi:pimeloyl-ACP methyl ester carboxylesterase/CRP-like cAMP-binding protein
MPIYQINGQSLHVVKTGTAHQQTAILLHGWSSSWYAMYPVLELVRERFRCFAVDLPGYGQSPPLPERTTIKAYADLIANFIKEVGDGTPVVLIGHSMGGMISITIALEYPELVERMVLLCPTITGRLSRFINIAISPITVLERFRAGSYLVSAVEGIVVGLTDRLMRPASFAERTAIHDDVYTRLRSDARRKGQGRVRAECFRAMREHDLSEKIQHVDTPALVIWGAEDNTVPLSDASIVDDEWWDADLRILPKAGHWPQFERPNATMRLIAAYLGIARYKFNKRDTEQTGEEEKLLNDHIIADFLNQSDLGTGLNQAQRLRLASQFRRKRYLSGEFIARTAEIGRELFIILSGNLEIWRNLENDTGSYETLSRTALLEREQSGLWRKVAILRTGQITGELALLDQQKRSADLIAGEEGAVVLTLDRTRLISLCEDDPVLGTRIMWNIGRALAKRFRFILWQLYYAPVQELEESQFNEETTNTSQAEDNIYNVTAEPIPPQSLL